MKSKRTVEELLRSRISILFREERRARGLSQMQLASTLEISQGYISKIDNGLAMPSLLQWTRFMDMFDLPSNLILDDAAFDEHVENLRSRAHKASHLKA